MSDCSICAYAREHGSWPTDHRGTHCEFCHRSWTGERQGHCVNLDSEGRSCCLHFAGDRPGDLHLVPIEGPYDPIDGPDYRCLTAEELLAKAPTESGLHWWVDDKNVWHYGTPRPMSTVPVV